MPESKVAQNRTKGNGREGYRLLDHHPRRHELVADLISRKPYRDLEAKYGIDHTTIRVWWKEQLTKNFLTDNSVTKTAQEQLKSLDVEIHRILNACKKELCNPDNPDEYDFTANAYDIDISYIKVTDAFKNVRKANLGELIERLESGGIIPMRLYTNKMDTRKLLIEAMKLAQSNINAIAKLTGELSEISINQQINTQVNVDLSGVVIPKLMEAIRKATEDNPEMGAQIADAIYEIVEEETDEPSRA